MEYDGLSYNNSFIVNYHFSEFAISFLSLKFFQLIISFMSLQFSGFSFMSLQFFKLTISFLSS